MNEAEAIGLFAATQPFAEDLLDQVQIPDLLLGSSTVGVDLAALEINGALAWDVDDVVDLCEQYAKLDVTLDLAHVRATIRLLDDGEVVALYATGPPRLGVLATGEAA